MPDEGIPSNHQLAIILNTVSTKLDDVLKNQADDKKARLEHEKNDSTRFAAVHKKIDGMYKYAVSIAVVAGGFGVLMGFLGKSLKIAIFGA